MSCPWKKFNLQPSSAALALVLLLSVLATPTARAQTQTFRIIHNFTAGLDGSSPYAGLTIDAAGNLYGTSYYGGAGPCNDGYQIGCGTVFQLAHGRLGWQFNPLYEFKGNNDGAYPAARVIFGPDSTLYGTTSGGVGYGTVFNLRPSEAPCMSILCPWTESVLYTFTGNSFGEFPFFGDLVFDQAGNLYGTTIEGGSNGQGVVYELSPSAGGWAEVVIYNMAGQTSGYFPYSGVIFDSAGNLYGTTSMGGAYNYGAVYQLTPSGAEWIEHTVYSFQNNGDGSIPVGGLIVDHSGNLYGTTASVPGATIFAPKGGGDSEQRYKGMDPAEGFLSTRAHGTLIFAFHGDYTPVLGNHSKRFSLEDSLAIGVDRTQLSQKLFRRHSTQDHAGSNNREPYTHPRWGPLLSLSSSLRGCVL
jgi:uncharacterized repeat protein (TIGR03803 family)